LVKFLLITLHTLSEAPLFTGLDTLIMFPLALPKLLVFLLILRQHAWDFDETFFTFESVRENRLSVKYRHRHHLDLLPDHLWLLVHLFLLLLFQQLFVVFCLPLAFFLLFILKRFNSNVLDLEFDATKLDDVVLLQLVI